MEEMLNKIPGCLKEIVKNAKTEFSKDELKEMIYMPFKLLMVHTPLKLICMRVTGIM